MDYPVKPDNDRIGVHKQRMIDVKTYNTEEKLKNGTRAAVRAIRPGDKKAILESFRELTDETLYSRFFAPKKELSEGGGPFESTEKHGFPPSRE
jgi:hypothetical protein